MLYHKITSYTDIDSLNLHGYFIRHVHLVFNLY